MSMHWHELKDYLTTQQAYDCKPVVNGNRNMLPHTFGVVGFQSFQEVDEWAAKIVAFGYGVRRSLFQRAGAALELIEDESGDKDASEHCLRGITVY